MTTMCMVVPIVQLEKKLGFTKTMHNEYKTSKDLKCYQRKRKVKKDMIKKCTPWFYGKQRMTRKEIRYT
jgi:hypothetical protein